MQYQVVHLNACEHMCISLNSFTSNMGDRLSLDLPIFKLHFKTLFHLQISSLHVTLNKCMFLPYFVSSTKHCSSSCSSHGKTVIKEGESRVHLSRNYVRYISIKIRFAYLWLLNRKTERVMAEPKSQEA